MMATFGISLLIIIYLNMDYEKKILMSISLPTILLFVFANKLLKRSAISFDWRQTITYVSLFGIVISFLSVFIITSYLLFPDKPLVFSNYLYYFYIILSIFSPIYLISITAGYPIILTLRKIFKKYRKGYTETNPEVTFGKENHLKRKSIIFYLSIIIFLSIIISLIPHLDTINRDNQIIGTDTKYYIGLLKSLADSSNTGQLLYNAFASISGGDRPFSLLFFFTFSFISYPDNFSKTLESLPLILGPILVICTYILTVKITRDHYTSLFASLIVIPSHILIGVYGGLYSNWLSLVWQYLAILFLFRIIDDPKRFNFFVFSILLILLILSHAQTWNIFLYVLGLFLIVEFFFINKRLDKKILLYIFFTILPSVIIDIIRMLVLDTSGIKQEMGFALQRDVGIHGLSTIWHNLIATTHLTLAGQIANPIILLLVIYWLSTSKMKEKYAIFLIVFFSLFTLPLLFADQQIQSRFLYEIPFQIPAAIGLTILKNRIGNYMTFAICLWLIVLSAYTAANFVLVVH
jgi:hypothetical protein